MTKSVRRGRAALWLLGMFALLAWPLGAQADKPEGLTAQTVKLPSGPASLKGLGESFSVNPGTGTGSFSIGLELPPGINMPTVSLDYTAGAGKGIAGLSFDASQLNVYRTTDKGSPKFDENDAFAISGPGINDELVRVDAARGHYRLRNEEIHVLLVRHAGSDSWTVRTGNGDHFVLGETQNSRLSVSGKTAKWYVSRKVDYAGHEVTYQYQAHQGQIYPQVYRYQLHAAPEFQNRVEFEYEARPDRFRDYRYGAAVTTARRLSAVKIYHGSRLLRTYRLRYEDGFIWSLLTEVKMEAADGLQMPPINFAYVPATLDSGRFTEMVDRPPLEGLLDGSMVFEDVNRDGLPDLLVGRAGDYHYYENIDGYRWSPSALPLANPPDRSLNDGDTVLADIDGDGYRDIVYSIQGGYRYHPAGKVSRGQFLGFEVARDLVSGAGVSFSASEVRMSDLNADGRTDLIWQKPGDDTRIINRKDGALFEELIDELPPDVILTDPSVEHTDFNGDGVLDFVRRSFSWTDSSIRVWHGMGGGQFEPAEDMINVPLGNESDFHLRDINRDGQTDLLRLSGSWATYYLNDGDGAFTTSRGSFENLPGQFETQKLLFADLNGNGTEDLVWYTVDGTLTYLDLVGSPNMGLVARVDNGMGAVSEMSYRSSTEFVIASKRAGKFWPTPCPHPVPVIAEMRTSDSLNVIGHQASTTRTSYVYENGYWDGPEREFRGFAKATITSHGDSFHDTVRSEQHMHVGRNLQTGADEEVLKGKVYLELVRDAQGNLLRTSETMWTPRWLCQEDHANLSEKVFPLCAPFPDRAANKEKLVATVLDSATLQGIWEKGSTPRYTGSRREFDAWGSNVRAYDYGEVRPAGNYEPGRGFDLGQADVLIGNDESISETDLMYALEPWIIAMPYGGRQRDISGAIITESRRFFDGPSYQGLPLGQAVHGRVTREEVWYADQSRWIPVARRAYNQHGQLVGSLDAVDNLVEVEFDPETHTFAVLERIHLESGPIEYRATYDRGFGSVKTATDFNGNTTEFVNDGLGRLVAVIDPAGNRARPTMEYHYTFGTPTQPISTTRVRELVDRQSGLYRDSYLYSDGHGRARLAKAAAEDGIGYVASGFVRFSARGTTTHVFDAFSSHTLGYEAAPSGLPSTVSYFDSLGRVTKAAMPATEDVPSTFIYTQYLPFETRSYDERDTADNDFRYPAITRYDGQGRVREIEKTSDFDGVYKRLRWLVDYDARDQITRVRDPMWSEASHDPDRDARYARHYSYDSLGRMIQVLDPSLGRVEYAYNDLGAMRYRRDALGQEEVREFGMAGRVLAEHFRNDSQGRPDYSHVYHYDEADPAGPLPEARNLRGRLAWVEFGTGSEHYSLDERGRPVTNVRRLWDPKRSSFEQQARDTFREDMEFTVNGKVSALHTVRGLTLNYRYNTRQLLDQVQGGFAGEQRTLFSNIHYDLREDTLQTDAGNGTRSCARYNARGQAIGLLTGKQSEIDCEDMFTQGQGLQHVRYRRGYDGSLASIQDFSLQKPSVPRVDASYSYDHLHQLTRASDAFGVRTYSYDIIQNLTKRTSSQQLADLPTGEFSYGEGGAGPNMVTSAGGVSYVYDAIGQMRHYNGYDLSYNVEGKLVEAAKPGGNTVRFYYDCWGNRTHTVVLRPGQSADVRRYVFDEYQERGDGATWTVDGAEAELEIDEFDGIRVDANLLDQLSAYVNGSQTDTRPLPVEYMDLDGDGDGFDAGDLAIAAQGAFTGESVGGKRLVHRYTHRDQLTSTTHVTDSTGELVSFSHYDPYGARAAQRGVTSTRGFADAENELDEELGLVHMGARFYAPRLGRFISADAAIGESPGTVAQKPLEANLYSYALNNPVFYVDPEGTSPVSWLAKKAAKIGIKKAMRELIKKELKEAIQKIGREIGKKTAKELTDMIEDIIDALDDPWWMTAIELTPVAGDVIGVGRGAKQLHDAWNKFEKVRERIKKLEKAADAIQEIRWAGHRANYYRWKMQAEKAWEAYQTAQAVKEGDVAAVVSKKKKKRGGKEPYENRVRLRKKNREAVDAAQPRNKAGKMVDGYNHDKQLKPGEIDIGHKGDHKWEDRQQWHKESGSTRAQVIEAENDPSLYHLEDRGDNRSHKNEKKSNRPKRKRRRGALPGLRRRDRWGRRALLQAHG